MRKEYELYAIGKTLMDMSVVLEKYDVDLAGKAAALSVEVVGKLMKDNENLYKEIDEISKALDDE